MTIAHAFHYRMAVLRNGIKSAVRVARARKAEVCFLLNSDIQWGQQVAAMFQIISTMVVELPSFQEELPIRSADPDRGRGSADASWLGGGLYKGSLTVQWSFGGGLLAGWCIYMWTVWQYFFISKRKFTTVSETSTEWTASTRRSETLVAMIGLGQTSAIATYRNKANRMRRSHDENGLIQINMYSLGWWTWTCPSHRMCLAFGRSTTKSLWRESFPAHLHVS